MGLFEPRIAYKPFEYPDYYTEGWLKQAQAFWLHTEIPMSGDVKDWNEKLTKEEKNLVGNILLGFAQTECAVSDYWTQKVVGWFPKHEIQQMAMMFGSQETIHAVAYSYLNETLGLENFEAFLQDEATMDRFENLVAYEGSDPVGIGKSLAIFSAFAEGVSLYSAFAAFVKAKIHKLLLLVSKSYGILIREKPRLALLGIRLAGHWQVTLMVGRSFIILMVIRLLLAMLSGLITATHTFHLLKNFSALRIIQRFAIHLLVGGAFPMAHGR